MSSDTTSKPSGYPSVMPLSLTAVWEVFHREVIEAIAKLPQERITPGFKEQFNEQIFFAGAKSALSILIRGSKLGATVEEGADLVARLMAEIDEVDTRLILRAAAALRQHTQRRSDGEGN